MWQTVLGLNVFIYVFILFICAKMMYECVNVYLVGGVRFCVSCVILYLIYRTLYSSRKVHILFMSEMLEEY